MSRIRVATFNVALNRAGTGVLARDLSGGDSGQARALAEIIQRVRPQILLLQEFDHQGETEGIEAFQAQYLATGQNGAQPITFPHRFMALSNTGQPSGLDLDNDGRTDGPGDALGYGAHPGQYAFVLLSQFPLVEDQIRSFRQFLWRDIPGARLPQTPGETPIPWYSEEALGLLPISSKNHVDVPVQIGTQTLHIIAAHPTPPVFDGPENRNGLRNYDEIRLLADYIDSERGSYLVDDRGQRGGLAGEALFVILGDLNADPEAGDSVPGAITQLLENPRVNPGAALGDGVPTSDGAEETEPRPGRRARGAMTAQWGLRVDYVLPSATLTLEGSGVFWPGKDQPGANLVGVEGDEHASSDHRLVWVDIRLPLGP